MGSTSIQQAPPFLFLEVLQHIAHDHHLVGTQAIDDVIGIADMDLVIDRLLVILDILTENFDTVQAQLPFVAIGGTGDLRWRAALDVLRRL